MDNSLLTPYELGNKNQTTTWTECIDFYRKLQARFPKVLHLFEIGLSDAGNMMHAGVVSGDGVLALDDIKKAQRPIFFNNNGIHPGEPEGIDACMALVRDLCVNPELLASMRNMVFLFIPIYNVDGCLNRNSSSRVNQTGPETFGFRGNAVHLDLNRDFIKCDSRNAKVFNQFFADWDPDLMVDTHTSNGADYSYTMTVIPTQPNKLGGELGEFVRNFMIPELRQTMERRGWPMCPYVNPVKETPDEGIEDFLDTPRFSTGYAALNYTVGMMPETHMLKSFQDRYESMHAFLEETFKFASTSIGQLHALRRATRQANIDKSDWAIRWKTNYQKSSAFLFNGYAAKYRPSSLGNYSRLYYDRSQPYQKEIAYYEYYEAELTVTAPRYYVVPQQWQAVIDRLKWNGVTMEKVAEARRYPVQTYHIKRVKSRPGPYEGHMFHDEVELETRSEMVDLQAGDYLVPVKQDRSRYAIETLEPLAHDSFFRWGFFNSVLERKEAFSNYVFEDTATELLEQDADLLKRFETWKAEHPELVSDQQAVLEFIYFNCKEYCEPEWRRYPVFRIV